MAFCNSDSGGRLSSSGNTSACSLVSVSVELSWESELEAEGRVHRGRPKRTYRISSLSVSLSVSGIQCYGLSFTLHLAVANSIS